MTVLVPISDVALDSQWTERSVSIAMEGHLGTYYRILDKGFIRVVDYMGVEEDILQAARVSTGSAGKGAVADRGLLRYLLRHRHGSPFEMAEIKVHLKMPLFVVQQMLRHRTANVNQASARYRSLPGEFYLPELDRLLAQSEGNAQGSSTESLPEDQQAMAAAVLEMSQEDSRKTVEFLTAVGLARELARIPASVGTYTELYWKIDVRNLMHFLGLRMDSHAQWEIRQYASALFEIFESWMPAVAEAFTDYVTDSVMLSGPEVQALREMLDWCGITRQDVSIFLDNANAQRRAISGREREALLKALLS